MCIVNTNIIYEHSFSFPGMAKLKSKANSEIAVFCCPYSSCSNLTVESSLYTLSTATWDCISQWSFDIPRCCLQVLLQHLLWSISIQSMLSWQPCFFQATNSVLLINRWSEESWSVNLGYTTGEKNKSLHTILLLCILMCRMIYSSRWTIFGRVLFKCHQLT